MQRAENLQPLSRQHKSALMTCLLIRKGIGKQAAIPVMTDFLLKVWKEELQAHFEQEEKQVIPLLNKFPACKAYADTILRDHELWRTAMSHLEQANITYRLLENLADQLEQHIRYEERIVFPALEELAAAPDLAALKLSEPGKNAICTTYPKRFWE